MISAYFYVTLKDDFTEKYTESASGGLFDNEYNPYLSVNSSLTPGKVYPVMEICGDGRNITVIDDSGMPLTANTGLFKYVEKNIP